MLPKKLRDFNGFIDGGSYIGRIAEAVLPKLALSMVEFEAGGVGPIMLENGHQALNAEITLEEYSREVLNTYGVSAVDGVAMRIVGAYISGSGGTDSIEVVMRGRFTEIDMGTVKKKEDTRMKLSAALTYFKYIVNGEEVIEIDLMNQVFVVNGNDRYEATRAALGI